MKKLILGPTDTLANIAIAVRELFTGIEEVQRLVLVQGPKADPLPLLSVAFLDSDGKWHRASSDSVDTAPVTGYGIVTGGSGSLAQVQIAAVVEGFSNLIPGRTYYLGPDGTLVLEGGGAVVVALGPAVSATSLLLQPAYIRDT